MEMTPDLGSFDSDILEKEAEVTVKPGKEKAVVVYNDEVNSFDHVITCLLMYCEHSLMQAQQCANIIHTKGKYAVKEGELTKLKPIKEALCDKGLTAKIE